MIHPDTKAGLQCMGCGEKFEWPEGSAPFPMKPNSIFMHPECKAKLIAELKASSEERRRRSSDVK